MKPFDLERALNGAKLVTRCGLEAARFANRRTGGVYPFSAIIKGTPRTFTAKGEYLAGSWDSTYDLFIQERDDDC